MELSAEKMLQFAPKTSDGAQTQKHGMKDKSFGLTP